MSDFKLGGRVIVTDVLLKSYGCEGKVEFIYPFDNLLDVLLDSGKRIRISESKVAKVEEKKAKPDEDVLYFLYAHDDNSQPKDLKDAVENWSLNDAIMVSLDIEEIKQEIRESSDSWANFFIIADNKLYLVNNTPNCPGLF